MQPIIWRPPTLLLMSGTDPVTPGGDRAGWISGSMTGVLGGTPSGSGMVAGAVTISGGAITAVAAPTAGGSGYPVNARFAVGVTGDGVGAEVLAYTNASGVVTSYSVINGGSGYTSAGIVQRPAPVVTMAFDCGPDFHQYPIMVVVPYQVILFAMNVYFSRDTTLANHGFALNDVVGSEFSLSGLTGTTAASRRLRAPARYILVAVTVANLYSGAALGLGMFVA